MRAAGEVGCCSASLRPASKRSSISSASLLAMARSAFRFSAYRATKALRWLFFSTALFFAMVPSPYPSVDHDDVGGLADRLGEVAVEIELDADRHLRPDHGANAGECVA